MLAERFAIDERRTIDPEPMGACRDGQPNLIGFARSLSRDQQVFTAGDSADFRYKVISGGVCAVHSLADGRRQIIEFNLSSDVFGVEVDAAHRAAAEAICDTVIISARRPSLAEHQPDGLLRHALRELQRCQDHLLTVGRRTAIERVAVFLIDQAEQLGPHDAVTLPMSRQDIADYLGLTIETVSRALTQLQARGLVRIDSRQVRLLSPAALTQLCE
jgi:CRP/FNR family nitrogen fixation transcriptional regulator